MKACLSLSKGVLHQVVWLLAVSAVALAGCASLINGKTQQVTITSDPPGAIVSVVVAIDRYGQNSEATPSLSVTTPGMLRLSRAESYQLRAEKQGYKPQDVRLDHRYSRWAYLDVLAVLLDLMVINEITGGLYAFDDLHVTLVPEGAAITPLPHRDAGSSPITSAEWTVPHSIANNRSSAAARFMLVFTQITSSH